VFGLAEVEPDPEWIRLGPVCRMLGQWSPDVALTNPDRTADVAGQRVHPSDRAISAVSKSTRRWRDRQHCAPVRCAIDGNTKGLFGTFWMLREIIFNHRGKLGGGS
jgi:hypothetical protein